MTLLSGESKVKNLVIHVDTGTTIAAKGLPLVYGHMDTFTLLSATITFESSHDCKAKAIEILFKAAVKTHYFCKLFFIQRTKDVGILSSSINGVIVN